MSITCSSEVGGVPATATLATLLVPFGRILPPGNGGVSVRLWPTAAERRPAREGPLPDPLLTLPQPTSHVGSRPIAEVTRRLWSCLALTTTDALVESMRSTWQVRR